MRDYDKELQNTEDHNYNYNFDLDVIHPYIIKSISPFFREGNLLELGSSMGYFTNRLLEFPHTITCVEASPEAIHIAKESLKDKVIFINERFESFQPVIKYKNIILTHVLEHIDDQISLLNKINTEWLHEEGFLFIVCPNANAPSRQIAVKMGLINYNSAVTESERLHGHNVTYTFDTLERDVKKSGLQIVHKSGIFFKAFANFQWDKLLKTDIINQGYLDGCYDLGLQYPELCSSILIICKRGLA
jgi:2-polyprenyl-3-methyl-5-hydroxy-6-metoxy-1,4-benzoquinol methylase